MKQIITFSLLLLVFSAQSIAQNTFNLDPTGSSRFSVTDKVWPVNVGEADVCMWNDDKLSAFTISIDDNSEADIPFWKTMIAKYGFNFTWFVITEADPQYNVQNWILFNDLAVLGSQINGHDDRNWYETNPPAGWTNPTDAEYLARLQATKTKVTTEVTAGNNDMLTYAYPFGEGNDVEARKLFIAIRDVVGVLNKPDVVDYLHVNSISNPYIYDTPANRDKYILPLMNQASALYGQNYYRGWGSTHFHGIGGAANETLVDDFLQYLTDKPDLWVAGFTEVAQYSQSFATHNLTVDNVAPLEIKFTLTDDMLDSAFYFPLSVKIRIDNAWVNVSATQNGVAVAAQIINDGSNKFALVKAVPDAGQVTVTGVADTDPAVITPVIGDKSMIEEGTLQVDFAASTTGGDAISFIGSNLPSFAVVTDNGDNTGNIVFTPTLFEAGVYQNITVVADNGRSVASQSFQLTVTPDPSSATITASLADAAVYFPVHSFVDPNNRVSAIAGGGYVAGKQMSPVFPFQLPALPAGQEVVSAKFQVNLESIGNPGGITGNLDLYGLPTRVAAAPVVDDGYAGTYNADASAIGLQQNFANVSTPIGVVETSVSGETALINYLNTQYQTAATGDYVFIRISTDDVNQDQYSRTNFTTADGALANSAPYPTILLQFGATASVSDEDKQSLGLYPNPVKDGRLRISLDGFSNEATLDIYSVTGQLVHTEKIAASSRNNFETQLNLKPGLYIVKLEDGVRGATQKLIVQ